MKDINLIEKQIREYLQDLNIELEAQEDWKKDALKRYDEDVKFFWREWCDRWEVDVSYDAVSKVKTQIQVIDNILNYFN